MKIYDSIMGTIGRTPLIRMARIGRDLPVDILLKAEFFNPWSSVKDRIGKAMIEAAERDGLLKPGMRVVEPTSGNTGIALAFVCAAMGYRITLVMPETMSMERRTLLLLLGAELILTPGPLGMRGAVAKAREIAEQDPSVFMPGQFDNLANPQIHRETTALEIWEDTDGNVDLIISGVGTGGTLTGTAQVLKGRKPSVRVIAVEPSESPVISGEGAGPHKIQGIGAGFIPANLDRSSIDAIAKVSSDEAFAMAKRLIKEEGIPSGISGGAAVVAALREAARPTNRKKMMVVIMPSATERYLSTLLAQTEREQAAKIEVSPVNEGYLAKVGNISAASKV